MSEEPIGQGATTLDFLIAKHPWLGELIAAKDAEIAAILDRNERQFDIITKLKSRLCAVCNDTGELQDAQAWDCGQENSVCPYCPDRVKEMMEELHRLKQDYPGGDQESQAIAWSKVWKTCEELGMLSGGIGFNGRERVIDFIRQLHTKAYGGRRW